MKRPPRSSPSPLAREHTTRTMHTPPRLHTLLLSLPLLAAVAGCTSVDEGERAVKLKWGKAIEVVEPGMHWNIAPGLDYKKISMRRETFDAEASAVSSDQQRVDTSVTVNYQVEASSVLEVYTSIGPDTVKWERELRPKIMDAVKSTTAHYTVYELISKRDEVKNEIENAVIEAVPPTFTINSVQLTNFTFSQAYNDAIEAKQVAEQAALRAKNELAKNQTEVKKLEQQAEAERNAAVVRAEGEAKALEIRGKAWAEYVELLGPDGVAASLRQQEIEKWDGRAPQTVAGGNTSLMLPSGGGN